MVTRKEFLSALSSATLAFPDNLAARRIVAGDLSMAEYHRLLVSLFHVAREVPSSTALAAARCPAGYEEARGALISYAARVGSHWTLLLSDLAATGYQGPDPRQEFADPVTEAYIAFNYYVAVSAPVARLGIIAVMDSISASFSSNYSAKLFQGLSLKPSQTSFFFRRDDGQPRESVSEALERVPMTALDWEWMIHAATTAAGLYKAIYDRAVE